MTKNTVDVVRVVDTALTGRIAFESPEYIAQVDRDEDIDVDRNTDG